MYVYALNTCVVAVGPHRYNLTIGEAWDAEDPVVRTRPEFFGDTPPIVRQSHGGLVQSARVEQATAAPGEKRGRRRGA